MRHCRIILLLVSTYAMIHEMKEKMRPIHMTYETIWLGQRRGKNINKTLISDPD